MTGGGMELPTPKGFGWVEIRLGVNSGRGVGSAGSCLQGRPSSQPVRPPWERRYWAASVSSLATSMGVIIGMSLWQEMLVLAIGPGLLGRGFINRDSGLWTFVSLILLVPLTVIFGRDIHLILFALGISTVLLVKRITANGESIDETGHTINVLLCRLIWDRDIRSRNLWISRTFN